MKIAIVAPSPVPFAIGGAETLSAGLVRHINLLTPHAAELIKLPSPERSFAELLDSYEAFSRLDLDHFDLVVSTKYPSWMVGHDRHVCYMLHRLRGLYDTYHLFGLPLAVENSHPEILALQRLMEAGTRREALPEFFGRARRALDAAPEACGFPGPLVRQAIHWLDGVGLSPRGNGSGAVEKYAALSATVARRDGYFPEGATVQVIHPPSNLDGLRSGRADYLFTCSRLDGPKRVALIVEAMRHVRTDIPLKIAGTGPEGERLKRLAAEDPRIEFLGFVPDRRLVELYADSLAVIFVPQDEDYGLIAVEAMASGKPLITVTDSGGPNELVTHGLDGLSVPPTASDLGDAIETLASNRMLAAKMGQAAKNRAARINWPGAIASLLGGVTGRVVRTTGPTARPKLAVAISFPIYPPQGGGQNRVYHLYRHLARAYDIDMVCLTHQEDIARDRMVAPGLREIRVPKSIAHHKAELELMARVNDVPITDMALPRLWPLTPAYGEALAASAKDATAVVACHPYLQPAIRAVTATTLWYECQDIEIDLKRTILPDTQTATDLLADAAAVEQACCDESRLIMVCADDDGRTLTKRYGADPGKIFEVPNGVDLDTVAYTAPLERAAAKRRLGFDRSFIALFIGSWHQPNIDAAEWILDVAPKMPGVSFMIMGSVGLYFAKRGLPANVAMLGLVNDATKDILLSVADCAINPVVSGGGTNLKMLDYLASGVPVLTTPYGLRGLAFEDGVHLRRAELPEFESEIEQLRDGTDRHDAANRVRAARSVVEQRYAWSAIADRFLAQLAHLGEITES